MTSTPSLSPGKPPHDRCPQCSQSFYLAAGPNPVWYCTYCGIPAVTAAAIAERFLSATEAAVDRIWPDDQNPAYQRVRETPVAPAPPPAAAAAPLIAAAAAPLAAATAPALTAPRPQPQGKRR